MKKLLALIVFLAAIGYLIVQQSRSLVTDLEFTVGDVQPVPALGLHHSRRPSCRSSLLIITNCEVRYAKLGDDANATSINFGFFGRTPADKQVFLIRSPKTGAVSTTMQIEYFSERAFYVAVLGALWLGLFGALIFSAVRRMPKSFRMHDDPIEEAPSGLASMDGFAARGGVPMQAPQRRGTFGRRGAN